MYLNYQVFDLGENAPDKVLHQLYATLEVLKSTGDILAGEVQKKLRIIVRSVFRFELGQKSSFSCCYRQEHVACATLWSAHAPRQFLIFFSYAVK